MSTIRALPGRLGQVELDGELPRREALGTIFDELDYQMACQVYLWALPLVAFAQWQHVHRDVFGATESDLVAYLSYRDRLGIITANATTPYIMSLTDLGETGPLLIELPPGPTAGGVADFWQRECGVLGEMGPDAGQGGTYLALPPGEPVPAGAEGLHVLRCTGRNLFFGFRALDPDPQRSQALVDAVRVHPFELRHDPPPTRVISPDGRAWSGDQPRGLAYFERLHEIYQREVVDERDASTSRCCASSGSSPAGRSPPTTGCGEILADAAAGGELMARANTFAKRFDGSRYWPDRQWDTAIVLDDPAQRGTFYDELLERASWFYEAVTFSAAMKSRTPGAGQAYLGAYTDASGEWLDGGREYTLRIPADPPAKLFWSVTAYDAGTRTLIDNDQQRGDRGSRDRELLSEADGSVDLHFGPEPPPGREANWIQTIAGRHWFAYLRLYGPLEPYFDHSWKPGDITAS